MEGVTKQQTLKPRGEWQGTDEKRDPAASPARKENATRPTSERTSAGHTGENRGKIPTFEHLCVDSYVTFPRHDASSLRDSISPAEAKGGCRLLLRP